MPDSLSMPPGQTGSDPKMRSGFYNSTVPATSLPISTAQIQTVLHEMGHWARVNLIPFIGFLNAWVWVGVQDVFLNAIIDLDDQRDSSCIRGGDDRCYGGRTNESWENFSWPFTGSNSFSPIPIANTDTETLVTQSNNGVSGAERKMLGNIDNFNGYLWNRWVDHGYCKLNFPP